MKTINLLIFVLLPSFWLIAQERNKEAIIEEEDTFEEVRKFRELGGVGLGVVSFRDLATSPLIYRGPAIGLKLAKTKLFSNKEHKFGVDVFLGSAFASVEGETSAGFIINTDLNFSRLYTLKPLSFKGWQSKVGGAVSVLFVNRFNPDLRNNSVGFEFFPTLFGSYKLSKDFTRHLPFRKKKGPRNQHISLRLDVGLINANFRNGFAYTFHSPFYNGSNLFENHELNWFSGIRIRSIVDYILYSKNTKNAIKVSYNWAGVRSGENPDRFALRSGLLSFSYLYRIK